MRISNIKTLILLAAAILGAGTAATAQERELANTKWELDQVNGRTVRSDAHLEIESSGRRFTGNTGCNRIFGGVTVIGRRIDFTSVGMTRRMCKLLPGSVPENVIVNALKDTVTYRLSAQQLSLQDGRGRTVLRFRLAAERPSRVGLDDRKWMLESIGSKRPLISIRGAFVNFDPQKSSVGGDSGCNVFGGTYSERNGFLKITDIVSTMRACEESDKMEIERGLLNGLRNSNRYEIRGGRLYLYRNTILLLTFRGERK